MLCVKFVRFAVFYRKLIRPNLPPVDHRTQSRAPTTELDITLFMVEAIMHRFVVLRKVLELMGGSSSCHLGVLLCALLAPTISVADKPSRAEIGSG